MSFSTVTVPSAATCSTRTSVGSSTVTLSSVWRKSSASIVATCDLLSEDHSPMECGWLRAYCFTASGARRSELPSRRTGLTADPFTRSYRARISRSASVAGSSG